MLVETDASANRLRSRPKGARIQPLRRLLGDTGPHPPWDDSAPIRAELFSVERLEEHARSLAAAQGVMDGEQKGAPLDEKARRKRGRVACGLSRNRGGGRRGSAHHPRGRVADRQLPSDRETNPRNPGRSTPWLLSATPQARQRTVRGIPARFRRDVGSCGPY